MRYLLYGCCLHVLLLSLVLLVDPSHGGSVRRRLLLNKTRTTTTKQQEQLLLREPQHNNHHHLVANDDIDSLLLTPLEFHEDWVLNSELVTYDDEDVQRDLQSGDVSSFPSWWEFYRRADQYTRANLKSCRFLNGVDFPVMPQTGDTCRVSTKDINSGIDSYYCMMGEKACASEEVPASPTHPTRRCQCDLSTQTFTCEEDWPPCLADIDIVGTVNTCPEIIPIFTNMERLLCSTFVECNYRYGPNLETCCDGSIPENAYCWCTANSWFQCASLDNVCAGVTCPDTTITDREQTVDGDDGEIMMVTPPPEEGAYWSVYNNSVAPPPDAASCTNGIVPGDLVPTSCCVGVGAQLTPHASVSNGFTCFELGGGLIPFSGCVGTDTYGYGEQCTPPPTTTPPFNAVNALECGCSFVIEGSTGCYRANDLPGQTWFVYLDASSCTTTIDDSTPPPTTTAGAPLTECPVLTDSMDLLSFIGQPCADDVSFECTQGQESCCGNTFDSVQCSCFATGGGSEFTCLFTDACLAPDCSSNCPPTATPPTNGETCSSDAFTGWFDIENDNTNPACLYNAESCSCPGRPGTGQQCRCINDVWECSSIPCTACDNNIMFNNPEFIMDNDPQFPTDINGTACTESLETVEGCCGSNLYDCQCLDDTNTYNCTRTIDLNVACSCAAPTCPVDEPTNGSFCGGSYYSAVTPCFYGTVECCGGGVTIASSTCSCEDNAWQCSTSTAAEECNTNCPTDGSATCPPTNALVSSCDPAIFQAQELQCDTSERKFCPEDPCADEIVQVDVGPLGTCDCSSDGFYVCRAVGCGVQVCPPKLGEMCLDNQCGEGLICVDDPMGPCNNNPFDPGFSDDFALPPQAFLESGTDGSVNTIVVEPMLPPPPTTAIPTDDGTTLLDRPIIPPLPPCFGVCVPESCPDDDMGTSFYVNTTAPCAADFACPSEEWEMFSSETCGCGCTFTSDVPRDCPPTEPNEFMPCNFTSSCAYGEFCCADPPESSGKCFNTTFIRCDGIRFGPKAVADIYCAPPAVSECPLDVPLAGDPCSFTSTCGYNQFCCPDPDNPLDPSGCVNTTSIDCDGEVFLTPSFVLVEPCPPVPVQDINCPSERPEPLSSCTFVGSCEYDETCCEPPPRSDGSCFNTSFISCDGEQFGPLAQARIACPPPLLPPLTADECPPERPEPFSNCTFVGSCDYDEFCCQPPPLSDGSCFNTSFISCDGRQFGPLAQAGIICPGENVLPPLVPPSIIQPVLDEPDPNNPATCPDTIPVAGDACTSAGDLCGYGTTCCCGECAVSQTFECGEDGTFSPPSLLDLAATCNDECPSTCPATEPQNADACETPGERCEYGLECCCGICDKPSQCTCGDDDEGTPVFECTKISAPCVPTCPEEKCRTTLSRFCDFEYFQGITCPTGPDYYCQSTCGGPMENVGKLDNAECLADGTWAFSSVGCAAFACPPSAEGEPCGGFQGVSCATGVSCVDNTTDTCDPLGPGGKLCPGVCAPEVTTSWPELDGEICDPDAIAAIQADRPDLNQVFCLPEGSIVTADFRTDRVRIFFNEATGRVTGTPRVG